MRTRGREGSSDVDLRTFWRKKHLVFRNLWSVPTDKKGGGLDQYGHFADKEGGINFSRFFADVFYGRPLMFFATLDFRCIGAKIPTFLLKIIKS